jgi:hypothetical protein
VSWNLLAEHMYEESKSKTDPTALLKLRKAP